MIPPLSQDVVCQLIDFTRYDRKTLLACSLVSTEWYLHTRKHVFYSLSIRSTDAWRSLVHFLSGNAFIRPYIQRLTLTCDLLTSGSEVNPSAISDLFPQLGVLHFHWTLVQLDLIHCFPHVHTLCFFHVNQRNAKPSLIPPAPVIHLKHISLVTIGTNLDHILDWLDQTPVHCARTLSEATIPMDMGSIYFQWLTQIRLDRFLERYDSVRTLNVRLSPIQHRQTAIWHYGAKITAPHVEHLHLSVEGNDYGAAQAFAVTNLSSLPSLRHLSIEFKPISRFNGGTGIFKPVGLMDGDTTSSDDWRIPPSVAKKLEQVIIALLGVRKMEDGNKLLGLLGDAGSRTILKVERDFEGEWPGETGTL